MKTYLSLVAALFATCALPASAQNLETNLNLAFTDTQFSKNVSPDSTSYRVQAGATYYLTPLDYGHGPYALAAFYGRNSSVSASYSLGEYKPKGDAFNLTAFTLRGNYIHQETGWFAEAQYLQTDLDTSFDSKTVQYGGSVGKYFAPTSIVSLGFMRTEDDINGDSSRYTLSNFHAQEIGEDRFFDAGFAVSYLDQEREDDGYLVELASTYYPTKKLGVGLRGAYAHVGEKDEFTYGAISEYFVNENLAFNASYTRLDSKADGFSIASNVFQFGTKVRF
ncbi:putative porin [Pseudovibrio denitrificans]|uniref:putative porin n=1 Tax=Pseudovibrio denitrificans TaxID=258256 RepID=UPI0039BEF1BC